MTLLHMLFPIDNIDDLISFLEKSSKDLLKPLREKCPNTEFFLVHIFRAEYGKIGTRKNSLFEHISHSERFDNNLMKSNPDSSNINEVIKAVLNYLSFFYEKILQAQKTTKSTRKHQKHKKAQKRNQTKAQNANERTKITNVLKKHLSGK